MAGLHMSAYAYDYCLLLSTHDDCVLPQCRQVAALEAELADAEENAKIAQNKYRKEVKNNHVTLYTSFSTRYDL
jgi:hypothetical protein